MSFSLINLGNLDGFGWNKAGGVEAWKDSLACFQRNRAMDFGESAKKWVADPLFFCDGNDAPLLPLSLDRFLPNFLQTRVQVVARDTWFHIPEKFPLRGWISRKTVFFRVLYGTLFVTRAMDHGKCSATPTLFPSPSGHPTDMSYLGDFCWGMYRFPAIHVWTSSCATV